MKPPNHIKPKSLKFGTSTSYGTQATRIGDWLSNTCIVNLAGYYSAIKCNIEDKSSRSGVEENSKT